MKQLITRFFADHEKKDPEVRVVQSQFPKLISLQTASEAQHKALVGWIAHRLAYLVGMERERSEGVFYLPFTVDSFQQITEEEEQLLLKLAEVICEWLKGEVFVEQEIKKMHLPQKYGESLLRLYSELQIQLEKEQTSADEEDKVWTVYRDVIYASTQGKFLLIRKGELDGYKKGRVVVEKPVIQRSDISVAREAAKSALKETGIKESSVMSYILLISEAITNILKHARDGKMSVIEDGNLVRVIVEDKGDGFPLKLLPKTTLMAGFSTKKSLGQGFTLMMKMAEQVVLETSSKGSTLILILKGSEVNP